MGILNEIVVPGLALAKLMHSLNVPAPLSAVIDTWQVAAGGTAMLYPNSEVFALASVAVAVTT